MKLETTQVPKETTVKALLKSKGLKPNLYYVSKNNIILKLKDKVQEGEELKIIPAVAGG